MHDLIKQVRKEKQQIVRESTLAWKEKRRDYTRYKAKIRG